MLCLAQPQAGGDSDEDALASQTGGRGKRQRHKKASLEQQALQLALKMGLNSQQQLQQIWACSQQVLTLPTDQPMIKMLIDCGTDNHNQTKREGKGHKLGKPFVHCWGTLVSFLVTTEWPRHNLMAEIKEHYAKLVENGAAECLPKVARCRIKETKQKQGEAKQHLMFLQPRPAGQEMTENVIMCIMEVCDDQQYWGGGSGKQNGKAGTDMSQETGEEGGAKKDELKKPVLQKSSMGFRGRVWLYDNDAPAALKEVARQVMSIDARSAADVTKISQHRQDAIAAQGGDGTCAAAAGSGGDSCMVPVAVVATTNATNNQYKALVFTKCECWRVCKKKAETEDYETQQCGHKRKCEPGCIGFFEPSISTS